MKKSNLLIDEYPLIVLPSLAKAIGLNGAIALQQLHYWLQNPKGGVEMDGFRWVYNTYEEWQRDNFPFWSVRTVQRVFLGLEKIEFVIAKQNATYDRKKYYRVHYDKLALWNETDCLNPEFQNGTKDDDKEAPSLTETTTETTQKKEYLIRLIAENSYNIFPDIQIWFNFRKVLESDSVWMLADEGKTPSLEDPMRIVIGGLSEKPKGGQFTLAQIWEGRFTKSFERVGIAVTFTAEGAEVMA